MRLDGNFVSLCPRVETGGNRSEIGSLRDEIGDVDFGSGHVGGQPVQIGVQEVNGGAQIAIRLLKGHVIKPNGEGVRVIL